jgi:tape measure domain-containing protein
MADEKRRLIYELLVEAKGIAQQTKAAQKELTSLGETASKTGSMIKGALAGLGVAVSLKGIVDAVDEMTKINEQFRTLGVTGAAAATSFKAVQDIAFTTGQSIKDVAAVYGEAIEAQQLLGLSQRDASKLAEAFTRSMVAQGKGAAEAAAQLQTLQFAVDKNTIKTKELQGLLKENETFQQAAQKALGKTTEELVKMASAGEITRVELRKILETFSELAADTQIGFTFDRIVESLKTMGKTFVTATADAIGLTDAMSSANSSGLKEFLDGVRRTGEIVGGFIKILFNLVEMVGQVVIAFRQFDAGLFSDEAAAEVSDVLGQQQKENLDDMLKGWQSITGEQQNSNAELGKQVEQSEEILRLQGALGKAMDEGAKADKLKATNERIRQIGLAAIEAQRVKDAAKAQREASAQAVRDGAERAEKLEIEAGWAKQVADYMKDTEENSRAFLDTLDAPEIPGLARQMEEIKETTDAMASTLAYAFEGLFTGATRNAKDFFREILAGFAQIFAQKAAMQAADFVMGLFSTGTTPTPQPSAKGNVFQNGNMVPFAMGGIVTGPTTFPMRGGRTGIMGEAGEEAVMPLRRMRGGQLGVHASAAQVHLHNNTGVAATARVDTNNDRMSIVLEAAQLGATMAEDRLNRSLRTGYGSSAQAVQGVYGLRRRV